MRRSVPSLARRAQKFLQHSETGAIPGASAASAAGLRAFAAAQAGRTPPKPADAAPPPGSPTAAAQQAIKSGSSSPHAGADASGSSAMPPSTPAGPGPPGGSSEGGGGGWFLPVLTLAVAGGGYYAYTQQQPGQTVFQQPSQQTLDSTQKAAADLLNKGKDTVRSFLPAILGGRSNSTQPPTTPSTSTSSSGDKLAQQKQLDQQEAGFKMLPPGSEDAGATTAAADAATAASAAARDSLSSPADEFPGSTAINAAVKEGGEVVLQEIGAVMELQHLDMTPIADLFADVTGTGAHPSASSSSSSSSKPTKPAAGAARGDADAYKLVAGVHAMHGASTSTAAPAAAAVANEPVVVGMAAAAAPGAAAAGAGAAAGSGVLREVQDSELDKLCQKLGLTKDLAPSGLVAAANQAGLGPVSTTGGHLPPQMAQLNQATADARVLREVMDLAATQTASLLQELEKARRQMAWTEEAGEKREASLTEHFKELMREQSRIHQELTAAAVKEAEQLLAADTAKAHLQERQERLALINELREKVNALAVAFEQRTAQLRSAQDVNKVSVGMLSLSRALEDGAPIGPPLQQLAHSCPDDPLVEAVAASLPATAVHEGLPTLQELRQRFGDVAQAAAEAAYFSGLEAQGGVLAHLAAKVAAKLKVDAGVDVSNTVDSKLSQARALLQQGQLSGAAEALTAAAEGTRAAAVVAQWVADARARAAADQAVKLLQAHATATAGLTT